MNSIRGTVIAQKHQKLNHSWGTFTKKNRNIDVLETLKTDKMAQRENNSKVWNSFVKSHDKISATCKICDQKLVIKGGSTSSLLKHLDAKHKTLASTKENSQLKIKDFMVKKSCDQKEAE